MMIKIDDRKRQDILKEMKALSLSYTPEWKFDTGQPDAASVIGMIFSDQMMENVKKLNLVMDKYHIAFENMYGMSRKAAIPAKTICTLQVSEHLQGGVNVAQGTQVIGTTDTGEEVLFALTHCIYAVNVQLTDIIETSDRFSMFPYYHSRTKQTQKLQMRFKNFSPPQGQKFWLRFQGNLADSDMAALFANQEYFSISSAAAAFQSVKSVNGLVEIDSGDAWINDSDDGENTAIVIRMKKMIPETIYIKNIELFMERQNVRPDFIWNGRSEVAKERFLPFTEQPALYNEFLIGQDFLLGQRGAAVTLRFCLDFERYMPKETAKIPPDLRMIKPKPPKMQARPQYECCIQEVTFEYYNRKGWRRLPASMDLTALFAREENAGEYHITFEIPDDWENVVQGGYEGKCIRMQIVRADNCYLQGVEYLYPVMSDVRLCMEEMAKGIVPASVVTAKGEQTLGGAGFCAFQGQQYTDDYVYWGFDRPFVHGPISLFVELENPTGSRGLEMSYAYSAHKGFQPLRVVDDTHSFQNSGMVMFEPPADMAACEVEGVKRFWIRIKIKADDLNPWNVPVVSKIYMNAVRAENRIVKDEQDYYMDIVTPNMKFPLYADNILTVQVWVNEREQLSEEEMNRLLRDAPEETKAEYNFLGEVEDFYVLWHEVDSFEDAAPMERCYCVDRGRNELIFGDGIHVKVPQNTSSIAFKARVLCCDGEKANIRANHIDRFQTPVLSIEEITNPMDAYGGTNLENIQHALKRGNSILSSRKRLVTEQDYIKEALSFSDVIDQAVCITGQDFAVSLVLLMKDYQKGDYSFRSIQDALKKHLVRSCEMTCGASDIQVVMPVFVRISVDVWLCASDLSKSMELRQHWLDRITKFLEPVRGAGSTGWPIGKLPESRQIRLMLNALEDTARMEHVHLLAQYSYRQHFYEIGLDQVEVHPFMVCCNGTHHVTIMEDLHA